MPARTARWASTGRGDGAGAGEGEGEAEDAEGVVFEGVEEEGEAGAGAVGEAGADAGPRRRFKNHFKRASSTMAELQQEHKHLHWARLAKARRAPIPDFEVGDALEIVYGQEVSDVNPMIIRGTVIAKKNKGLDSSFTLLNSIDDETVTLSYPYSSPLLKSVRVHTKWRLHEGKRRTRRAKLYYLEDRPPKEFMV